MWVLGLNWLFHDAAACLVDGTGTPVAFSEEERFRRSKHAVMTPPTHSAAFCLRQAGIEYEDVDVVAVGWDIPSMFPEWYAERGPAAILEDLLGKAYAPADLPELVFVPHHDAHAHCVHHASGYGDAAVLIVDGSGERESASIYRARPGKAPECLVRYPIAESLGAMYEGVSRALGLGRFGTGKTMGLASYGRGGTTMPEPPMTVGEEGPKPTIELPPEISYLDLATFWEGWFRERLGELPPPGQLDESEVAVEAAWTCQELVEGGMLWLSETARRLTGREELCLAGGVALNCSANGLLEQPVYVPPCAHDAGVALGAAWAVQPPSAEVAPVSPYLGLECTPEEVDEAVAEHGGRQSELDPDELVERLLRGEIGAVVDGRAEVGPRALGHRSIVALPRPEAMRDLVNGRKGRERWRPLAPIALSAVAGDLWQNRGELERYMLGAAQVTERGRSVVPATVHVDGTARGQVVDRPPVQGGQVVGSLLSALERRGEPPVLINTSFNLPREPIVNDARNACRSFAALGLDFLVIDGRTVERAETDG